MRNREEILRQEKLESFNGVDDNSDIAIIKQNKIIIELLLDIRDTMN